MDENQGMTDGNYLELLNKPNRSMQEENDLQAEIKRRQEAEKAANPPSESTPAEQPVEPAPPVVEQAPAETPAEVPAEPAEQPAQPEVVPEAPQEPPAPEPDEPYTLDKLESETSDAIAFLESQNKTLAVEMAKASFAQAAYWTKLASEGK